MGLQSPNTLAYSLLLEERALQMSRSEREGMFGEKKIRCVLAHNHGLLRQGLRRLLDDEADLVVVGETGSISEAAAMAVEYRPDVVITASGDFGRMLEHLITSGAPQIRVVFVTSPETDNRKVDANSDGIRQTMHPTSFRELLEMVRKTQPSGSFVVREMPLRTPREWPESEVHQRKRMLTAREREVLKLLAEGRTVRAVAKVLGLSVKTVDAHKFNLMRKLGIHNKTELVMWAIQRRIVKLPANF